MVPSRTMTTASYDQPLERPELIARNAAAVLIRAGRDWPSRDYLSLSEGFAPCLVGRTPEHTSARTEDLAPHRAMRDTARNIKECARRESNPRPSA